jgi:hypothetical protein
LLVLSAMIRAHPRHQRSIDRLFNRKRQFPPRIRN